MLGFEKDYVLKEPLSVDFGEVRNHSTAVTIPAGAHVKQTFYKDGVSFVTVYGSARQKELEGAGKLEK
jgi:hypothetical protein